MMTQERLRKKRLRKKVRRQTKLSNRYNCHRSIDPCWKEHGVASQKTLTSKESKLRVIWKKIYSMVKRLLRWG